MSKKMTVHCKDNKFEVEEVGGTIYIHRTPVPDPTLRHIQQIQPTELIFLDLKRKPIISLVPFTRLRVAASLLSLKKRLCYLRLLSKAKAMTRNDAKNILTNEDLPSDVALELLEMGDLWVLP